MSEDSPANLWIGLINSVRHFPMWVLLGIAGAGWVLLLVRVPEFVRAVEAFYPFIALITIAATVLSLTRAIDLAIAAVTASKARKVLRIVASPPSHLSYWAVARQPDGSVATHITIDLLIANLSDRAVRIESTELVWPRVPRDRVHAFTLAHYDGHAPSSDIVPGPTDGGSASFFLRKHLGSPGRPMHVSFRVIDHRGVKYTVRNVRVLPIVGNSIKRPTWLQRLRNALAPAPRTEPPRPVPTDISDAFTTAKYALQEEQRQYAANGRTRGGLGSLNTGLQSEPNYGWTEAGKVPPLLWEPANATPLGSSNLDVVIRYHRSLGEVDQAKLEEELLKQLDIASPYANVAYFIWLVLYRTGHGVDGFRAARERLACDPGTDTTFGLSNLLGTLAAIVSREHFSMSVEDLETYKELAASMPDEFRLREKLNLALLRKQAG